MAKLSLERYLYIVNRVNARHMSKILVHMKQIVARRLQGLYCPEHARSTFGAVVCRLGQEHVELELRGRRDP